MSCAASHLDCHCNSSLNLYCGPGGVAGPECKSSDSCGSGGQSCCEPPEEPCKGGLNCISGVCSTEDPDRPWWEIGKRAPARDISEYDEAPPELGGMGDMVTKVMGYLFPIAGFICLIFIIQGGYMWMISSGNPESLKKAQGTLTWAVIGLVLTMTIFGILTVVINFLYK
jgi:hypothetical protein